MILEHPQNNRLVSKFRKPGDIQQKQIMRVQRKVRNIDGHFTPLGRSKRGGMRNWDSGCCSLDGALCSVRRHDHPSCVLMYFARDTWTISFPVPCLCWISWLPGCFPELEVLGAGKGQQSLCLSQGFPLAVWRRQDTELCSWCFSLARV